jgi:hypothetical protein
LRGGRHVQGSKFKVQSSRADARHRPVAAGEAGLYC